MPTNPVVDTRGETDQIAKSIGQVAANLRSMFQSAEDAALEFYKEFPQQATQIAIGARYLKTPPDADTPQLKATRAATAESFRGMKPEMVEALERLIPITETELDAHAALVKARAERKQKQWENDQITGPQKLALAQVSGDKRRGIARAAGTAIGGGITEEIAPPTNPIDDLIGQAGVSDAEILAAAPEALKIKGRQDRIKTLETTYNDVASMIDPEQRVAFQALIKAAKEGAPDEMINQMYEQLLPTKIIEGKKLVSELRNTVNLDDANKKASPWVHKHYKIPGDETLPNAYETMMKWWEAEEAASRKRIEQANDPLTQKQKSDALLGAAMQIWAADTELTPNQIQAKLLENPAFAALPPGLVYDAAVSAPGEYHKRTGPQTEAQARTLVTFGPAKLALARINELEAQGRLQGVGILERLAQAESSTNPFAIGGAMVAAGRVGAMVSPLAAVGGAVAAGALVAGGGPLARYIGREFMSADQGEFWDAVQSLAATVYRHESGAAVRPEEIRITIERYVPLSTDSPQARLFKARMRDQLRQTLLRVAGMPNEIAKPFVEQNVGVIADETIRTVRTVEGAQNALSQYGDDPRRALQALEAQATDKASRGMGFKLIGQDVKRKLEDVAAIDDKIKALESLQTKSPEISKLLKDLRQRRKDLVTITPIKD